MKGSQGPGLGPPGNVHACAGARPCKGVHDFSSTRIPVARPRRRPGVAAHGKATQITKQQDDTYARAE
jgi:hypothetical protein